MTDKPKAALWAALPALAIALTGWLQAETAARKTAASKEALRDNYQGYIEDRLKRDEALQEALDRMLVRLAHCDAVRVVPTRSIAPSSLAMQLGAEPVDLDELAKGEGYRP